MRPFLKSARNRRASDQLSLIMLALCIFCVCASPAWAEGDFEIRGFGTLGAAHMGETSIRRDVSRDGEEMDSWNLATDSVIGIQFNLVASDALEFALQLVGKDRAANSLGESVEWAYGVYRLKPDTAFRFGRMGFDVFMLSEYRNLGFAYLWVRPPIEFYGSLAFDYFDGVDLSHTTHLGEGVFRIKGFLGKTRNQFATPDQAEPAELDIRPVLGFNLEWENEKWRLRGGFARLKITNIMEPLVPLLNALESVPSFAWPEAPALRGDMVSEGRLLTFYSAGLSYETSRWTMQTEVGFIDSNYSLLSPRLSAYTSLGYKLGRFTFYTVGAAIKSTEDRVVVSSPLPAPNLLLLQAAVQNQYNSFLTNQRTLSLGTRWNLADNMALKIQWDRTWVDEFGGALQFNAAPVPNDTKIDTISINLDFLF